MIETLQLTFNFVNIMVCNKLSKIWVKILFYLIFYS